MIALKDPVTVFRILFDGIYCAGFPIEFRGGNDRCVGRAHREVEKERLVVLALFEPLNGFADHARLVLHILDVFDDLVLLDDRADVAGVGETVEVVEAKLVRAAENA